MKRNSCEKQTINRGAWSSQEDEKLVKYICTHGEGRWRTIPKAAGLLRCGKSCRLRWINYLRPDIKRGNFTEDEDDLIIKLHALLGNRWSLIAGRLPGRTDNEIKNHWNSRLSRKLIRMGVDRSKPRWISRVPRAEDPALTSETCKSSPLCRDRVPDDGGVSREASCREDHLSPTSDLNLDLTISLPFALHGCEGQERSHESAEETHSPTLLLFR
ncbi:unnamed protein product [Spirodela intermedia]|uniref:Uncharacterized protein n=1 Tax=Spirodela intermedia TaxID=51605 RepID=A0A7I8JMQ8_SPIIN|nr:unnamed protein product [Spirodela intermedia]CAA6671390.1 unnamed protein product [Spirodela intermedia]